jgi:hypothetical protein
VVYGLLIVFDLGDFSPSPLRPPVIGGDPKAGLKEKRTLAPWTNRGEFAGHGEKDLLRGVVGVAVCHAEAAQGAPNEVVLSVHEISKAILRARLAGNWSIGRAELASSECELRSPHQSFMAALGSIDHGKR